MATQLDKVVFPTGDYIINDENNVFYGTCTTAAATTAKVVTCDDFNELVTGATIHVKFTYQYTESVTPTLNVNSTGAKSITVGTYTSGNMTLTKHPTWNNKQVVSFTYDGTNWCMNEYFERNTDTEVTQTESTTNADYEVLLSGTASTVTRTEGSLKSSGFRYNPSLMAVMEGDRTYASATAAHAEGGMTTASGMGAHAEGAASIASGMIAHTEGQSTLASGNQAHAEGYGTTASGWAAHAEGNQTYTNNFYTHAEGYSTTANGEASHAEGYQTYADGYYSHTEGCDTTAGGHMSHAEGENTYAQGKSSHAEGSYTIANHRAQHVFGEYNLTDASTATSGNRGDYVEIVGNGLSSTARSNARTLDWNGNEWLAGNLDLGGTTSDIVLSDTSNTWDGVNTSLKSALANIIDLLHPVGSIYMSLTDSTVAEVEAKFGGTWEKIEDRFLLAASSNYSINTTGGSANAVVVSHEHDLAGTGAKAVDVSGHTHPLAGTGAKAVDVGGHTHTEYAGINEATSGLFTSITGTRSYPNTHIIGGAGKTSSNGGHGHSLTGNTQSAGGHGHSLTGKTTSKGESGTGKNMPPYLAVYMYKRTA